MEMNTFTAETTTLINMPTGHCADNDVKDYDNLITVKELGWRALSDSLADDQNICPAEDMNTRMQVERSININRLVYGNVMKLQPSCE